MLFIEIFFPICILILKSFRYRKSRVGFNYFELTDLNLLQFGIILSEEIVQENHAYFEYYIYRWEITRDNYVHDYRMFLRGSENLKNHVLLLKRVHIFFEASIWFWPYMVRLNFNSCRPLIWIRTDPPSNLVFTIMAEIENSKAGEKVLENTKVLKTFFGNFRIFISAIILNTKFDGWSVVINPHAPDRYTLSRARCTEKCGSALTHRIFGKKIPFLFKMMLLKVG